MTFKWLTSGIGDRGGSRPRSPIREKAALPQLKKKKNLMERLSPGRLEHSCYMLKGNILTIKLSPSPTPSSRNETKRDCEKDDRDEERGDIWERSEQPCYRE